MDIDFGRALQECIDQVGRGRVVYFPWAKVLHIADLFGWGMIPLARYDPAKIDLLKQRLARVLERAE